MILNIKNETSRLKAVVLGNPYSMGQKPELKETFDAKSFYSVLNDDYPTQQAVIEEMKVFENVLKKHGVQVFRPYEIENYNQIYARDIAFVIDEKLIIANLIEDRKKELEAFEQIFNSVSENKIIRVAEDEHIEGGDVILWNEFMFVGTYKKPDYPHYKTARTNAKAIQMLKTKFPDKWVIDMELHKNDSDPYAGVLHLDCCFQPVGKDKAIIYKDAFINPRNYETLIDLFGRKNIFEITKDEFFYMTPNIFSIAPDVVVSEENFTRLNRHMRDEWGIQVEEIPYQNISKMGGLLRCSTMPLIRE
ncbi:arginine deiminase [Candidatus Ornithobacterium hominis]|uniref:arginine deiminase n=1 Tax=Candidatus Ornithobacterium hominis TaxID=2497989 RepID=A0A383U3F8_9FLAO|nr:arginine deiminase family protein [Candidatus Ornithobacterium hominis]MCT7904734.1 arginine deiminase family protein [Candidatus Ornithobacterium hominis]CAI9429858.1 Arginine deiminase [Candidatus Ornithobacterium hominis]SZD73919.1 arginine deiminase [Candidatus Ornithobacterium hominis]